MSIGLDLGTTEFRSIRDSGGDLIARRCRASYLVVKDSPGHRKLLENTRAIFGTCGDDLVILGDDAIECGAMLGLPAIPLLRDGRLPNSDPVARQILALMAEAILPPATQEREVCCLTVPGGYGLDGDTQSVDVRFLKQLASLRGYAPQLISSGLAVVLAELAESSFSGLGISLGAVNCEVGVIHCGRELARSTVEGRLADLEEPAPTRQQDSSIDVDPNTDEQQRAARERNRLQVLTAILTEAREALVSEGSIRLIHQPTVIACTGGITRSDGFANLFQQAWNQSGWPVRISRIQIASNPRFSVARGGLIKAILEGHTFPERRVA